MRIQCFLLVFSFILLKMCYSLTEPPLTSGTFRSSMVSAKDCINPDRPYMKNPPIIYHPVIQNIDGKNILGGNLTILKDTKDVQIKIKSYIWRNDKWHPTRNFNNLNCHGVVLHLTFSVIKIKYDKKNCMFSKGFYSFNNIDVNQLQHIWGTIMPYGRQLWRAESHSQGRVITCKEFVTVTEPA